MKNFFDFILILLRKYKYGVIAVMLVAIIVDMIAIPYASDIIVFVTLGVCVWVFRIYKLDAKDFFGLCLIPIFIIFIGYFINPASVLIEKASVWLFLLMGTGIVHEFLTKQTS